MWQENGYLYPGLSFQEEHSSFRYGRNLMRQIYGFESENQKSLDLGAWFEL
jgi:hypothetical protein